MKLLKNYIVGLLILLITTSCVNNPTYRYNVPEHWSCRLLSKNVWCINTSTNEEKELSYKEAIGFVAYHPDDYSILNDFANMILEENAKFSKCKVQKCIIDIIKQHNATSGD